MAIEQLVSLTQLKANLNTMDVLANALYFDAERIFKELDKDEVTTELKILTSIGAECAAIKLVCNKLKIQFGLLEEMLLEKAD